MMRNKYGVDAYYVFKLHVLYVSEKNECSVEDMARKFSNVSVCSSSLSSLKGQVGKTLSQLQNLLDIIEKTLSKEHHDKSSMLFGSPMKEHKNCQLILYPALYL